MNEMEYEMTNPDFADAFAIRPFSIHVSEEVLSRIRERVRAFRWEAWSQTALIVRVAKTPVP